MSARITVADVVAHIAFEVDRTPAQVMRPSTNRWSQEARLAAIWVAEIVCGFPGRTALGEAFGVRRSTAVDWLARADELRRLDDDFGDLTDNAMLTLRRARLAA